MWRIRTLCFLAVVLAWPSGVSARAEQISALCDAAGAYAARVEGVPQTVLQAITLTETGRTLDGAHRPWPWTVNMEGTGKWFPTRDAALAYVMEHYNRGARSFDVGCFQINYRWHGNAFTSIEQMFDPQENALYAGRFLRSLYLETNSWSKSAGAYHSRTPQFAKRYAARFDRILASLTGGAPPGPPTEGEYAHNMTAVDVPVAETPREPPRPGPLLADVPPGWVPPPPSATGSLAAIDHLPRLEPLLTAPRGGLY